MCTIDQYYRYPAVERRNNTVVLSFCSYSSVYNDFFCLEYSFYSALMKRWSKKPKKNQSTVVSKICFPEIINIPQKLCVCYQPFRIIWSKTCWTKMLNLDAEKSTIFIFELNIRQKLFIEFDASTNQQVDRLLTTFSYKVYQ